MSRIIKSFAVVDDRTHPRHTPAEMLEANLDRMPVIKKQIFDYRENPYADPTLILPDKQGYLDELNRIKVQIEQAKAELRGLGREIGEARDAKAAKESQTAHAAQAEELLPEEHSSLTKEEVDNMFAETRAQIAQMMEKAQAEAAELALSAQNDGYLAGFEQGFAQAKQEYLSENEPKAAELSRLLERLSAFEEDKLAQNERELIALATGVAKKVIGQEIKAEPRAITTMLYQALDHNRREEDLRITLSPELMPVEAKVSAEIKKIIAETAPSALLYTDADAPEGTIIMETSKGITDLSVDTQLENINELLNASE